MADETHETRQASSRPPHASPPSQRRSPTVFVTDAAAESARIAETLRIAGYLVIDVPISILVARAQVQRPNVVLVDVDAPSALDEVTRLRKLPGAGAIDFVYFGSGTGAIKNTDDAIAHDGSAFFVRPVDLGALARRVEALTGGPTLLRPEARLSTPPPRLGSTPPERPSTPSLPAPGLRTPGPPLPMSVPSLADLVDPPRSLAMFGTVSSELQQLLAEAELRAEANHTSQLNQQPDAPLPSPEEEIEAVLPADVLASLDEPIEGDEDEEHDMRPGTGAGHDREGTGTHGKPTTAGGSKQTTASGRSASSSPQTFERRLSSDKPAREAASFRRTTEEWPSNGETLELPRISTLGRGDWSAQHSTQKSMQPFDQHPSRDWSSHRSTQEGMPPFTTSDAGPAALQTFAEHASPIPPSVAAGPRSVGARSANARTDVGRVDSATVATVDLPLSPSQAPDRGPSEAPPRAPIAGIVILQSVDARRFLADAISRRLSGAIAFEHDRVVRRIVVRDGDLVTAASGEERESLVCFLGARGELPRDEVERLSGKIPPYGRHAGAALVAHGWLGQDQLWSALRAHAEWIATSVLRLTRGTAQLEAELPGRLRSEPSVFAASTGAEIFVELVRRAVSPREAIEALGGEDSRIGDGPMHSLLSECALAPAELELVARARGGTLGELLARSVDAEIASVVHGLALLGILDVLPLPAAAPSERAVSVGAAAVDSAALDEEAVRARIRARLELVEEGDYFSVLGVTRDATSYEVRRAFVELRRTFEPTRILTPRLHDLADDVRKIVVVLEEAYEILRDDARRDRYRRAIEARPG